MWALNIRDYDHGNDNSSSLLTRVKQLEGEREREIRSDLSLNKLRLVMYMNFLETCWKSTSGFLST
jgi:hypothetical protein